MPPPRTIVVDRNALLIGIHRHVEDSLYCIDRAQELLGETWRPRCGSGYQPWWTARSALSTLRQNIAIGWVRYDLPAFLGRELTDSERTRYNQAVREMEDAELVEIFGKKITEIRLAEAGKDKVAQLLPGADGKPDNQSSRQGAPTPRRL